RASIRDGTMPGPRVWAAGRVLTTSQPEHARKAGRVADDAASLRRAVRDNVADGVDAIKIYGTARHGTPGSIAEYTVAELTAATEEAHGLGRRVLVHCNGSTGLRRAVAAGADTIEHVGWIDERGYLDFDEQTCLQMIERGVTAVPTMSVWYGPFYEGPAISDDKRWIGRLRAERTRAWKRMHDMGVRFATGTDTWDPTQRELELMVAEMGVRPMDAIVAATRDAAVALGAERDLGTLEPGKFADLIEVGGDPSHDIAALRAIRRVWKGGVMVTP
ncbi:MAG: amidohydrolase family protein, partial [Chloroflexi bacterium]|nr:amidohydrolase family protein [Chloroflexota bacterium]